MRAIGIRELRQQASRYLREVQRGETIEDVPSLGSCRFRPAVASPTWPPAGGWRRLPETRSISVPLYSPPQEKRSPARRSPRRGRRNADVAVYLDSSALVKLVVAETESAALSLVNLRSLDAIHLAAARALGHELVEVITYDRRMPDAADHIGLPVSAPA